MSQQKAILQTRKQVLPVSPSVSKEFEQNLLSILLKNPLQDDLQLHSELIKMYPDLSLQELERIMKESGFDTFEEISCILLRRLFSDCCISLNTQQRQFLLLSHPELPRCGNNRY